MKLHGNAKDLTGQRFGKLIVLFPTEKRQSRSIVWHCKCDCGKETDVASKHLIYGSTQSCGCAYSLGETHIKDILDKNLISYKKEYTININNLRLRYDFAIYENNKIIRLVEFDGPHHHKKQTFQVSEKQCNITQQHDLIKNQWAKEQKIPLVRIPYSQRDKITLDTIFSNKYLI